MTPRQIPGMARLMPLTADLLAHYSDPAPNEEGQMAAQTRAENVGTTAKPIMADRPQNTVPAGWTATWRVTGKDRLSDRWTEQKFTTRAAAVTWAKARAFLMPRQPDGVVVRCVLGKS